MDGMDVCGTPRNPFRHGPQNHFLYCPLHRGLRVGNHAPHGLLPSPLAKRTHHSLTQPDISCANDTSKLSLLTGPQFASTLVPASPRSSCHARKCTPL